MSIEAASVSETYQAMKQKLGRIVPDVELRIKAELVYEIHRVKHERGAIVLGHNYMEPALYHTVCDYVGDSLELSRLAAKTDSDPIVFCGVRFMAETAKILNPSKTVLLPAVVAGCSLAESINAEDIRKLRQAYPGVPIVAYINTYAEVKAEVDICCTSSNARRIVETLDSDRIIFLPDEYLAANVARETGKSIFVAKKDGTLVEANSERAEMIGWNGRCEVHEKFTVNDIKQVREQFPGVKVVSHPECSPDVVAASDYSDSTSRMTDWVKNTNAPSFLILTECSMGDNIIAENPDKEIVRLCSVRCPHMNEITLEDTLKALRENVQEINVPDDIRRRATRSLERMLAA
ncbi:MAG: quinolinate synthase NadA [Bdellovibrionales bacterium]|nr:quinolinate synthase NadA [Bdellovibrionales bacterium]